MQPVAHAGDLEHALHPSGPRTSASSRSAAPSARSASATARSPLESMNSSRLRSSTTRSIPSTPQALDLGFERGAAGEVKLAFEHDDRVAAIERRFIDEGGHLGEEA